MKSHLNTILRISWPIIVAQLGMVLTGFFDNLMVSQLGYHELAAAGISNSIYFLIAVFPMGITIAYATVISILEGRAKRNAGSLVFRDATYITAIISVLTIVLLLIAAHNFHWFKQDSAVELLAKPYLILLAYSSAPMLFFFFVKNLCDGYQYTQAGMQVTLITLALNVFLNWVFIFGNLGFQSYGLNGAGYATILSRTIGFVIVLAMFIKSDKIPIYKKDLIIAFSNPRRHPFYNQILKLGIPSGLQFFFEVAAFVLAAILAGWLGPKELAAHQLAITLAALTYMFASGLSSGASIAVARSYGTKNIADIKQLAKAALLSSSGVMIIFAVLFLIFNNWLAQWFSEDAEVVAMGAALLIYAAIFQLSDGVQAISIGLLRGIEDVKFPSLITLLAYWLVAIPVGYYLGFKLDWGINGIWFGLSLGLTCSAILLCIRFYSIIKTKV
ncbi:MAG: MATE family efflux transporter [Bacteroidia bacterium]